MSATRGARTTGWVGQIAGTRTTHHGNGVHRRPPRHGGCPPGGRPALDSHPPVPAVFLQRYHTKPGPCRTRARGITPHAANPRAWALQGGMRLTRRRASASGRRRKARVSSALPAAFQVHRKWRTLLHAQGHNKPLGHTEQSQPRRHIHRTHAPHGEGPIMKRTDARTHARTHARTGKPCCR